MSAINLKEKFSLFTEQWTPKVIAECNGQLVKLAKIEGEFVWHNHKEEDELFLVVKGSLKLKFRDTEVTVNPGELYVVSAGVDHLPITKEETWVMLIEPASTLHTGEVQNEKTVANEEQKWI